MSGDQFKIALSTVNIGDCTAFRKRHVDVHIYVQMIIYIYGFETEIK